MKENGEESEQKEDEDTDKAGWSTEDSHVEGDQKDEGGSEGDWEHEDDLEMLSESESDDSTAEDHHEEHE